MSTRARMQTQSKSRRERRALEKYLKEDEEKIDLVRVLAQRVRQNLGQLRKEIDLIEKFNRAYERRNGHD
jgi:DNA polymerase III delta subunit